MPRNFISRLVATAVLSGIALSASAADSGWYGGLGLGRSTNYEDFGRVGDPNSTGSARDGLWAMALKVNFQYCKEIRAAIGCIMHPAG